MTLRPTRIGTYLTMMQVATPFEHRQNKAKNDNVVSYKCTMYIKLLNASNKLFQLGNIS